MMFNMKFWKRGGSSSGKPAKKRKTGPRELPQAVGQHLVVKKNEDPDYIWSLKCVMRPRAADGEVVDIRIYNPEQIFNFGIHVIDYASLDHVPESILYQGWYDKESKDVHIEPRTVPAV